MKKRVLTIALLSGLAMTAGAVQAQGERDKPDFATLDLNGDGALTLEEMQNQAAARFAAADADGNGGLSLEELTAAANGRMAERLDRMFDRLDANEDGLLQADEMRPDRGAERAARMFDRIDADDSGTITQAEFDSAREAMRDRGGKRQGDSPRDDS